MAHLLLILSTFLSQASADHAFYVSVIEIRHIDDVPSATISIKIFSDDLQTAIRNEFGHVELAMEKLCLTESAQIQEYFKDHLQISVNGTAVMLDNTSCGFEGDAHQLQFSMNCPAQWKSLEISADYFMEVYPTQTQMVHIKEHGENYTLRLSKSKPAKRLAFAD